MNKTVINLMTYDFAPPLHAAATSINDDFLVSLTFSPDESHAVRIAFRIDGEQMEQFLADIDEALGQLRSRTCHESPVRVH